MKKTALLFLLLTFFSCTNSENYEKIIGEWECASWINKSNNSDKCYNNVYFKFELDKTYFSKLGQVEDSGEYKIANNILYSTPKGKLEIAVQINKLNTDTLELKMNQAGVEEILTLVRKH